MTAIQEALRFSTGRERRRLEILAALDEAEATKQRLRRRIAAERSTLFLVFNERRDSSAGGLVDRALVAKMTYMVAF